MQPVIAVLSQVSGILYLNGSLAGEVEAAQPLIRPVAGRGALLIEFRPFSEDFLPMARRLVFSGGAPLQASAEEMTGANLVLWPGNVVEIELAPKPIFSRAMRFDVDGHPFSIENGRLFCDGRMLCALPAGAEIPTVRSCAFGTALMGNCADGRFFVTLDSALAAPTGALTAKEIEIDPDGRVRALLERGDLVGHGTLETWRWTPDGLTPVSSESVWTDGAPKWPKTPEETARAFVEACLAGLDGEAEGYLAPPMRQTFDPSAIRARCDLCVRLKYAPRGAWADVGLLCLTGENLARVEAMEYAAIASGSPQGPYKLERIVLSPPQFGNTQEFNVTGT